jgi:hypothetical protein
MLRTPFLLASTYSASSIPDSGTGLAELTQTASCGDVRLKAEMAEWSI